MALISVIVPTYNAERTIKSTLESVLSQTFRDIEILIINDGSTDNTLDIIDSFCDERLKIISFENAGLAEARNRGIFHSQGEYISFIDADDIWVPQKLEFQLNALKGKDSSYQIAYSWTTCLLDYGNTEQFIVADSPNYVGDIYEDLLQKNFIGHGSNILVKRSAIDKVGFFDKSLRACEDWDYYLRLANLFKFVVIPKRHIKYRKSLGSMSLDTDRMKTYGEHVLNKAFQTRDVQSSLRNKSLSNLYLYCAGLRLTNPTSLSDYQKALGSLLKAAEFDYSVVCQPNFIRLHLKLITKLFMPKALYEYLSGSIKDKDLLTE